jgi:hypothetical protein
MTKCDLCKNEPELLIECVEFSKYGREIRRLLCRTCVWGKADTPSRVIVKYVPNNQPLDDL